MNTQISDLLRTIPKKKILDVLNQVQKSCEVCTKESRGLNNCCEACRVKMEAYRRYANSNIPIRYWFLNMKKDFSGSKILLDKYNEIVNDINLSYANGICICFAGMHGVGKTLTSTNILKKAAERGFSSLFVTLGDVVDNIVSPNSDKAAIRYELLTVDFLVIDEFDSRYMTSDSAAELYGKILENIIRTRVQNMLPIILCTNSPNVIESFSGPIRQSIESLMNYIKIIPVVGDDYRRIEKK